MTSYTKSLMLAAAACAIAAGNAAAQTYHAEIPFTFRAGSVTMAPGSYDISLQGLTSGKFLMLRNSESKKGVLLATAGITGERKGGTVPKLRFACGSRCALESMFVGGWQGAYKLPTPRLGLNETARVMTVELTRAKTD
jgi:hypothetical protein